MANPELISELVRAHYAGDQRRFGNLLNQFIASESRAGHVRLAQRLRDLRAEADAAPKPTQLARAPGTWNTSSPSATATRVCPTSCSPRRITKLCVA